MLGRKSWHMCLRFGTALGFLVGALLFQAIPASAQSIIGGTSLIRTPTARMPEDGLVRLSAGFVPRQHRTFEPGDHDLATMSVSMGFMPFLEVGFRMSPQIGVRDALGDRMVFVRARVLEEKGVRPAVVVGLHDFLQSSESTTTKYHAFYVVGSKRLDVQDRLPLHAVEVHAGFAPKLFSVKGYEFAGPFGGIAVSPTPYLELIAEYDSHTVLIGQRLRVFNLIQIVTALQQFDSFTGGVSVLVRL